jgi:hypothetical protein
MKNDKLHTILLIIAIVMMVISFVCVCNRQPKVIETRDTTIIHDTVWKDTTIIEKQLVPKEVIKKKVDTVYTNLGDTLHLVTESKMFDKRFISSKDTCDLQIYTTGIKTSLDSLKWRLKTHKVNTTEIVEIIKYEERKKKWIHIQPQATFGYDPLNKQWGAVVGLGIGVDL